MPVLNDTIKNLPKSPGVYRFYDNSGNILYIGKAKNLKNRVSSYFQEGRPKNQRLTLMVSQIDRLEYTVVSSEKESLILEANLIHTHQPKYNILLKDDRNYLYVRITKDEIPGIFIVRRKFDPRSKYYGPYTKKYGISETLRTLRTIFPYCQEKIYQTRPCSYVGIKQCDGICVHRETIDSYKEKINQIENVLSGRIQDVEEWIKIKIQNAVSISNFALASLWKDRLILLKETIGTQKIILPHAQDLDIITLVIHKETDGLLIGSVFMQSIREAKMINVNNFILIGTEDYDPDGEPENEIIQVDKKNGVEHSDTSLIETVSFSFLSRFISSMELQNSTQKEVFIQVYYNPLDFEKDLTSAPSISIDSYKRWYLTGDNKTFLENISRSRIYLKNVFDLNQKEINDLLLTGKENAVHYLNRNKLGQTLSLFEENNLYLTLVEIKHKLGLKKVPRRIECYDISHLSGTYAYGSMVTFIDGRPMKKFYRLFKVKDQNNDFENQMEVLRRRLMRYINADESSTIQAEGWKLPDLFIIDGGKGQLNAVMDVFAELNQQFKQKNTCFESEICSLAKREEEVFLPGNPNSIMLEGQAKFMFQRIRDEAHRFAITNNRNARLKSIKKSSLDNISGIGDKTKRKILTEFGSIENLVKTLDSNIELVYEVIGPHITKKLKKYFSLS